MTSPALSPSSLFSNVVALAIARIARTALQFFITPVILMLLGPEQYGLVAFSMTLQMVFLIFDQALSPTVIREFGRMEHHEHTARDSWNLFHTFERLSFSFAALIGIGVIMCAPYIADTWLNAHTLDRESVVTSVRLMGVWLAAQWPTLFYASCFTGLQRQGVVSALTVAILVTQTALAVAVLHFWRSDVSLYIAIQAVFMFILSLSMRAYLTQIMPRANTKPRFDTDLLKSVHHFASGTFVIGITTVILTQADKILAAKWVSLNDYAAYGLAFAATAQFVTLLLTPLNMAIQPVMARMMKHPDQDGNAQSYHRLCQMIALTTFTCLGMIAFYAKPLLTLWLGETSPLVEPVSVMIPLIALGYALNAASMMPAILQMATGWIRLKIAMNIVLSVLFVPAFYFLFPAQNMMAGPILWVALNLVYIFIETPLVHRKFFKGEYANWLLRDVLLPGLLAVAIFTASRALLPDNQNSWIELAFGIATTAISFLALLAVLPLARETAWRTLDKAIQRFKKM